MNTVEIFFGPSWFSGIDLLIDLFGLIVLMLISFFAFKIYKLDDSKHKNFSMFWSLFLLSLGFLFKVFTYGLVYCNSIFGLNLPHQVLSPYGVSCAVGAFSWLFRPSALLTLLGLSLLFLVSNTKPNNKVSNSTFFMLGFLSFVIVLFSNSMYYVFHLASLGFLVFVSIHYFKLYKKNNVTNTHRVAMSFALIAVSHLIFLLAVMSPLVYFLGELIQLIGFLLLLATFISVLKYGKEKGKT